MKGSIKRKKVDDNENSKNEMQENDSKIMYKTPFVKNKKQTEQLTKENSAKTSQINLDNEKLPDIFKNNLQL